MKTIIKNKKIMIALATIVILIVTAFIVRRRKNGSEEYGSSLPEASFPLQPYSVTGEYSAAKGSYGQQIATLQELCITQGAKLNADGYYGPKSEAVFQQIFGKTSITEEVYDTILEKFSKR
ncbi:MAG: hypothetical protein IKU01_02485 [Bacteroidales bacterium]|nr:hypothetical protein [Bacteroidales bacterium]